MKKLEDIPKKNVFEVPDGYFDQLPGRVQARIEQSSVKPLINFTFSRALRYALPIVLLMVVGVFWYRNNSDSVTTMQAIETELEDIQPGQLAVFLDDRELTTDELVETVTWSPDDLNELENTVNSAIEFSNNELEKIIDEYDEL